MPYDLWNEVGYDLRSGLPTSGVNHPDDTPRVDVICVVVCLLLAEQPDSFLSLRLIDQRTSFGFERGKEREEKPYGRGSVETRRSEPEAERCTSGSSDVSIAGVIETV